jgi:hypothetical protein
MNEKTMRDDKKKLDPRVEYKIINEAWMSILLSLTDEFEKFLMMLIQNPGFKGNRDKLRTILRDIKAVAASLSSNEGPGSTRQN